VITPELHVVEGGGHLVVALRWGGGR
jgi:hypothetical protein